MEGNKADKEIHNTPECNPVSSSTCKLYVENARLRAEVTRLQDLLFARGTMEDPPCFCCGYNGPGYYQPDIHPCAARHHDLAQLDSVDDADDTMEWE